MDKKKVEIKVIGDVIKKLELLGIDNSSGRMVVLKRLYKSLVGDTSIGEPEKEILKEYKKKINQEYKNMLYKDMLKNLK
jgi:hypothetical protein